MTLFYKTKIRKYTYDFRLDTTIFFFRDNHYCKEISKISLPCLTGNTVRAIMLDPAFFAATLGLPLDLVKGFFDISLILRSGLPINPALL